MDLMYEVISVLRTSVLLSTPSQPAHLPLSSVHALNTRPPSYLLLVIPEPGVALLIILPHRKPRPLSLVPASIPSFLSSAQPHPLLLSGLNLRTIRTRTSTTDPSDLDPRRHNTPDVVSSVSHRTLCPEKITSSLRIHATHKQLPESHAHIPWDAHIRPRTTRSTLSALVQQFDPTLASEPGPSVTEHILCPPGEL